MFEEIWESQFNDISEKTKLLFGVIKVFGYSPPFSMNIFINIDDVNRYSWSA